MRHVSLNIDICQDNSDNNDIMYYSFSSFPALCYYAEHGYTDQDEVNIPLLKRNFGMWQDDVRDLLQSY